MIQTEWSLSQQEFNLQVGLTTSRRFCNSVQSKTPKVCVTGTGSGSLGSRCFEPPMGEHGCLRLQPVALLNKVVSKVVDQGCRRMILIAPGWPNMPWFWDLVCLSVQIPFMLPLLPDLLTQPFNGLPHRDLKNLHAWLLEPPLFMKQGFSEEVKAKIEAPQRLSTRAVYKSSGPFLTRWTLGCPV